MSKVKNLLERFKTSHPEEAKPEVTEVIRAPKVRKKVGKVKLEQISDWAEGPVTIELLEHCNSELEHIQQTSVIDCYVAGEPVKTQENVVELEARERMWTTLTYLLAGDWSYFEEDEEEEWTI